MASNADRAYAPRSIDISGRARPMFGLSFGKLLVLAAVIAFVWFGWRKVAALADGLKRGGDDGARDEPPPSPETVDLVRDPKTGRYEPRPRPEERN